MNRRMISRPTRGASRPGRSSFRDLSESPSSPTRGIDGGHRLLAAVVIPSRRKSNYETTPGFDVVKKVLSEIEEVDQVTYRVRFGDNHVETITFDKLISIENGASALDKFNKDLNSRSAEDRSLENSEESEMELRKNAKRTRHPNYANSSTIALDSDSEDELNTFNLSHLSESRDRPAVTKRNKFSKYQYRESASSVTSVNSSEESDVRTTRQSRRSRGLNNVSRRGVRRTRSTRFSSRISDDDSQSEGEESGDAYIIRSDVVRASRKRQKLGRGRPAKLVMRSSRDERARSGTRKSSRSTRHRRNMRDREADELSDSDLSAQNISYQAKVAVHQPPKAVGARENYKTLPTLNEFRRRHVQGCETCGNSTSVGPLVYCQGCIFAYHKNCLGNRNGREHLATKVGDDDFVLQCRRCINGPKKKESRAPDLAKCQACNEIGQSSRPFSSRKTNTQEQKEREDNGGEDPITTVAPERINNPMNVLFRCLSCFRAFHFHHLQPRSMDMGVIRDDEEMATERFAEYCVDWKCQDCLPQRKVSGIIAWRPTSEEYEHGTQCEFVDEEDKQYLIKWEKQSYFRALWMPGAWTWGVTAPAMRKAFFKKENGPKSTSEDAIPEEFLRIDIVLDVKFTSIVDIRTEEILKARIKEVDEALLKYKGLGYEDAVWEKVPIPEDGERWADFVTAYDDWVLGRYVHLPKGNALRQRLEKARTKPFSALEKSKQPDSLVGGELMKYQIDGLNWVYYQWYSRNNGILADEMGLGKTIQVISFMATLIKDHACFPFLVVVPNSTCANWRREIKQWAPSLRVVTYFGSATARTMAYQYEMKPENSTTLRCHIVVTSYQAAADDSCIRFFKSVPWSGLIVDEGQRLKSDESILYGALNGLKIPFKLLMTGTPLQNNARELFNLIQFLDESKSAAALEEEYADMNKENVIKLHNLIRPFILRRTKAQVLTFLPPVAQIILPISMSVLQKRLYKSILAKNPELLRALFTTARALKQTERANLNNILMQLRKCLCHPFVYSREIEERTDHAATSHRNLVEASAKLQLLELLLPALKERGHRVLIFSQFLSMLDVVEDFLDGLELRHQRLDGSISSLQKQKRIDEFNAPNSTLFAFLLSTRAGGVGINLATADTVIILDPDFNPHQDIQALSRAHRIGQKNKVLCFQLMTRASAEEKIVQIGRKKMALDHVIVEQLDAEDLEEQDVESILKHGAAELFKDDGADEDIRYDNASIEALLDRSQIENTKSGEDKSAESQFSFARVWENQQGSLQDNLPEQGEDIIPDPSTWDQILKERDRVAAAEAAARTIALGRGKRSRGAVSYGTEQAEDVANDALTPKKQRRGRRRNDEESDTDFQAPESEDESEPEDQVEKDVTKDEKMELAVVQNATATTAGASSLPENTVASSFPGVTSTSNISAGNALLPRPKNAGSLPVRISSSKKITSPKAEIFKRVTVPNHPYTASFPQTIGPIDPSLYHKCQACTFFHPKGGCPLKIAGVENCNLCGLAHYGIGRVCPHVGSETQVREMLETLKQSNEPRELVDAAMKYLRGVKGHLVQKKKKDREKAEAEERGTGTNSTVVGNTSYAPIQNLQQGIGAAPVASMQHRNQKPPKPPVQSPQHQQSVQQQPQNPEVAQEREMATALLGYLMK